MIKIYCHETKKYFHVPSVSGDSSDSLAESIFRKTELVSSINISGRELSKISSELIKVKYETMYACLNKDKSEKISKIMNELRYAFGLQFYSKQQYSNIFIGSSLVVVTAMKTKCTIKKEKWDLLQSTCARIFNERQDHRGKWIATYNYLPDELSMAIIVLFWATKRAPANRLNNILYNWSQYSYAQMREIFILSHQSPSWQRSLKIALSGED